MSRQTTTRRRHGVRRMSERKRLTITAISAVLALVTVVICALSGVFNFHKGNERILPNLVGQTEESAKAQLAELDAEPSITYENSDEAKGIVADNCVTVRDRDTMEQVRMPISELKSYIESKIEF